MIHETRGAAMTCYQFVKTATVLNRKKSYQIEAQYKVNRSWNAVIEVMIAKLGKELPERVITLSKSVIECCDKGSDCATKIKATTKKHSHANKRGKHFYFYFSLSF